MLRALIPARLAKRTTECTESTPALWPATEGRPCCLDQRRLPSMIMATWAGRRAGSTVLIFFALAMGDVDKNGCEAREEPGPAGAPAPVVK
ncbi:MAG: hypothetical protein A3J70_12280 [Elusimicrobia bacterium RIFCSPHIGHO2_02_FULL_61_10]|nr:MAG: hypothetical protein A3J70_12280 [Elusimicrobia bacterium RIFCSPHIGHO2_02_FULL_61_10]